MKFLVLLALGLVSLSHQNDVEEKSLLHHWENFKLEHMKEYIDEKEEEIRKEIFLLNFKFVNEHNTRYTNGESSFEVAINRFADLTSKEFRTLFNGFKHSIAKDRKGKKFVVSDKEELPDSVDWRAEGAVTDVKDQGKCGSCWAFSTTGALEGQTFVATKKLVSLSEQNLIDCSTRGNKGCNGGLMDEAFAYIKKNGGIDTEETYPYEGKKGKCRYKAKNKGATDNGFVDIPSGSEEKLKAAIALKGPVSVAIDASHMSFQLYKGGVYQWLTCGHKPRDLDHGVLVVGYGTTDAGVDYWLIKNSWGTSWGMEGYMMLARNHHNMCGVATMASYPIVSKK